MTEEKLTESCRRLCTWDEEIRRRSAAAREAVRLKETLTSREAEVAVLLAWGLPNKTIAGRLSVSEQAVKIHPSNIYAKLGVRTAVEIAALLELAGNDGGHEESGLRTLKVLS